MVQNTEVESLHGLRKSEQQCTVEVHVAAGGGPGTEHVPEYWNIWTEEKKHSACFQSTWGWRFKGRAIKRLSSWASPCSVRGSLYHSLVPHVVLCVTRNALVGPCMTPRLHIRPVVLQCAFASSEISTWIRGPECSWSLGALAALHAAPVHPAEW